MFKKMTVLAMAVGVVAALALPASASATWKHHQSAIQSNAQLGLTGQARFQGTLGGIECQVTSRAVFIAGQTTGTAETFVPHPTSDTANCKGLGGLAFCQTHNLTPQAPGWTFHTIVVNGVAKIQVTTTTITSQTTGGFCPVKHISLAGGEVTLDPAQDETVSSASLSGTLGAQLQTNDGTIDSESVTVSGTLNVESPNAATYSI
ncbi:MAG TPA: hypothetical protein VFY48_01730 [Solirubrobacterales bacterium]|nr:hypothetical protein [Solirubrobacterales bacterium]